MSRSFRRAHKRPKRKTVQRKEPSPELVALARAYAAAAVEKVLAREAQRRQV